jgi:hypothetical protein
MTILQYIAARITDLLCLYWNPEREGIGGAISVEGWDG